MQALILLASQDGLYFIRNSVVNIYITGTDISSCVKSQSVSQPINKLIGTGDSCFRISILRYTYTVYNGPASVYL
jgi:hypothetical protein